jgi:PKD repeat protein
MKKLFLLSALILCMAVRIVASPVDPATARLVAKNMYYERANIGGKINYDEIQIQDQYTIEEGNTTVYYIFNISGNKGWVAVSGDNVTIPVLSYALEGTYGSTTPPANFVLWMKSLEDKIMLAKERGLSQNAEAADLWLYYSNPDFMLSKSTAAVSPLLGSIAWGQGCYYNTQCPTASMGDCGHVPTGCVATAMAMIMKYHAYPTSGFGSHSYTHATYGTLSANFGTATYVWSSMPNTASGSNTELAEIMKHCGVSVDMNYDVNGSGAYLQNAAQAFNTYFIYAATYESKDTYSDADWKTMIKTNIDNSRPILYAGQDASSGGHAFVLDGYQGASNDYFHFNWGWDGSYNSYNYVTSLIPGNQSWNGDFSTAQEAVMGIYPNPAVTPQANFTSNSQSVQVNGMIIFTDISTNTPLQWSWSITPATGWVFVSSTNSSSQNPRVGFTATGTYSVSLTATNSAGSDTESKNNYITVTGGAGISESAEGIISISPNPAKDVILLNTGTYDVNDAAVILVSTNGQQIARNLQVREHGFSMDVSDLSAGMYTVVFKSRGLNFSGNVMITR